MKTRVKDTVFNGSIIQIRDIEDCIRATRKYTKGAFTAPSKHPIQGGGFPSRVLTEYYEVYPDLDLTWDMLATDAWAWVWGDVLHIDVKFHYAYKNNNAKMEVFGTNGVVKSLCEGISGFKEALDKIDAE